MSEGCYHQCADECAEATGRHQYAVTISAAAEHIARERRHDDHVRPTEDADRQKQQQDSADALLFDRIKNSVPGVLARGGDVDLTFERRQSHQYQSVDDSDEAETVKQTTRTS